MKISNLLHLPGQQVQVEANGGEEVRQVGREKNLHQVSAQGKRHQKVEVVRKILQKRKKKKNLRNLRSQRKNQRRRRKGMMINLRMMRTKNRLSQKNQRVVLNRIKVTHQASRKVIIPTAKPN